MYFSQCQEDEYLHKNFFFNKKNGVYIELGALDGVDISNTKFFEDTLNWTGILIEPHPEKYKLLEINRPNNFLFNDLVSCYTDPLQFRYFIDEFSPVSGVESTLPQEHLDKYFESNDDYKKSIPQTRIMIQPKTFTEIIKKTNLTYIDFLSLDVEGHEYEVLKSWDFSIPIYLILIEVLGIEPERENLCKEILINNGYKFITKFKHNEIYILEEYKVNY